MNGKKTIKMLKGETWFACVVGYGEQMPFDCDTRLTCKMSEANFTNQTSPLMLSSAGRVIHSEDFDFEIENGKIIFSEIKGNFSVIAAGKTLKDAYLYAMERFYPANGKIPPEIFFRKPQFNDWMEVGFVQTQQKIISFAEEIKSSGYPYGVLMIDDKWSDYYGAFDFNGSRFHNPKEMFDKLHEAGFKVMLWETPFITADSPEYRELSKRGLLIKNADGDVALREWWNGFSAILDLSNPKAAEWLRDKNDGLMKSGADGFKLDGGDSKYYRKGDIAFSAESPNELNKKYSEFAEEYEYNELRSSFGSGGRALVQRQSDKRHSWESLKKLIPSLLVQSLSGYAYSCPDMVGGGSEGDMEKTLDEELFVRYAECAALMPMIQFSKLPFRHLNKQNNELCKKFAKLHESFSDYIVELARRYSTTNEPICRPICYEFPDGGYEREMQMFMLGDKFLVAPVVEKGQSQKTVRLPSGKRWKYVPDGKIYDGGEIPTVNAPIDVLPFFEKL